MDEKEIVVQLIKLYSDNSGYFEAAVLQSKWALGISVLSIFVSLILGWYNHKRALKALELEKEKMYKGIITAEKVKAYNLFRDAGVGYLDASFALLDHQYVCSKQDKTNEADYQKYVIEHGLIAVPKYNHAKSLLELQLSKAELALILEDMNIWQSNYEKLKSDQEYEAAYIEVSKIQKKIKEILEDRWREIEIEAHN